MASEKHMTAEERLADVERELRMLKNIVVKHLFSPVTLEMVNAAVEREKITEEMATLGHSPTLKARNKLRTMEMKKHVWRETVG